jgi:glutamine amidotransferase
VTVAARVAIVDYGAGNLRSVQQALLHLGADVQIVADPAQLVGFSHLLLPGVGSFRRAMASIVERGLDQLLRQRVAEGVPLLGICLGMQLLASRSSEDGETPGLGLIAGDVDRFGFDPVKTGLKIPHVGFAAVTPTADSRLFAGIGAEVDFYFTHSFRLQCRQSDPVAATTWHGEPFVVAVEQGVLAGTQFHPEKSQANGLRLLANFLERF